MDLEQRVKALEQELQVLKNQIQVTLLDIQSQLLTNAYPVLRAENDTSPEEQTRSAPRRQVSPITAEDETPADIEQSAPKPAGVQRFSLDNFEDGASSGHSQPKQPTQKPAFETTDIHPHQATAMPAPKGHPPHGSQTGASMAANETLPRTEAVVREHLADSYQGPLDWEMLRQLEEWIERKIEQIGFNRTRRLINTLATKGQMDSEAADTLLELVDIYEEESDDSLAPPSAEAPTPLKQVHMPSNGHHGQPAGDFAVHDILDEEPAEKPIEEPVNGYHRENKPIFVPRRSQSEEEDQKLILRLIAGIQNVGMKWSKPNDG